MPLIDDPLYNLGPVDDEDDDFDSEFNGDFLKTVKTEVSHHKPEVLGASLAAVGGYFGGPIGAAAGGLVGYIGGKVLGL
jgi:hypothetical protein